MNTVELHAAELLLDRGVRYELRPPFFLRWIGVKKIAITIKRPVLGAMMRISAEYLKMGVEVEKLNSGDTHEAHRLLNEHGGHVCRIVAYGMIRGRWSGKLLAPLLGWYLRWHADAGELAKLAVLLIELSGVQHFTNTIRFLAALKMTTPRNLSPEEEGSQKAG